MKRPNSSNSSSNSSSNKRSLFNRRALLAASTGAALSALMPGPINVALAQEAKRPLFQRIPVQYIAALADPEATRGNNAEQWGIWRKDPGPRGVKLDYYDTLKANDNIAPANWTFNENSWWLEEHGLIMEPPEFPLTEGHYLVTGSREKHSMLTVHAPDANGHQQWSLDDGANIYDVTHLRCRSAIYTPAGGATPADGDGSCSPASALQDDFPVTPGADMPSVKGCDKQDYMVLIVYAIAQDNA